MSQLQKWSTPIGAFGIALIVGAFLLGVVTPTRRDVLLLLGGLGAVLVGFYMITRPRDATRQKSNVRIASEGLKALAIAAVVIGVIVAINYFVDKQYSRRLDLTANQQNTLSPQTLQILQTLQEPIQVTGFFNSQTAPQREQAQRILKNYQNQTDKLVVQMVDPDENPALAQKYDNVRPGAVVFEKGARTEKVYDPYEEGAFTNALLKVTQTQQPAIYFTTGHGEYDPNTFEAAGMGALADYLKQINYKIEPLNLATLNGTLPADTSALVIAGPTKPFSPEDEKLLQTYLEGGGRVLLMNDVNLDPGLGNLLKEWGMSFEKNLVLDPGLNYRGNIPYPVFLKFPQSPVTENLETYGVYLPGAQAIQKAEDSDKDLTALFTTTEEACAKTDFEKIQQQAELACDDADTKGPFVVGYAGEGAGTGGANDDARARLIVLGNASFVTNQWMNNPDSVGNQQLFSNMINWLAGQEELIAIPPRDSGSRPLTTMTGNDINLVFWTSVVLVPLAALVIGGLLWWKRR